MVELVIAITFSIIVIISVITHCVKSVKTDRLKVPLEREYQKKHENLESAYAAKVDVLEKREQKVALQEERWKTVDKIAEWASRRLRTADERERDLAHQEHDLEKREHLLHRDIEEIIDYRVENQLAKYIRNKSKGLTADWRNFFRESSVLKEDKEKMYKKAMLISGHLGVPLYCILNPKERKLVGELANELPEERYALMDLVMSCPDDQAKDLLEWMQRFPQSSQR